MKVALKCFQSLVLQILPMPAHSDLYSPLDPIVETNALFAPESVTLETIMALFRSFVAISTLSSGALESTETRAFIFSLLQEILDSHPAFKNGVLFLAHNVEK